MQQLPVAYNIRNLQIESDAALLRTFKITGATQFQIGLGYFETIISAYHDFQSFPGVLRQLIIRHQNTIRLFRSTSYPATQLMQLRKPETFCIFNNHHRSIRDVHSDFNDGSSHHDLRFARNKKLHLLILLGWFHFAMHFTNRTFGKLFQNMLISFFKVLQINLFAFFNQRIDNVDLTSFFNLFAHRTVHTFPTVIKLVNGSNRFPSGWKLVDNRHVQITIQCHCQSAWDRGSSHHEHMWRLNILTPKAGALCHAKAMLFVDNNET